MFSFEELKENLAKFDQEHLLRFWSTLTDTEKEELACEINEINFGSVLADFQEVMSSIKINEKFNSNIKPVPKSLFGDVNETSYEVLKSYENKGLKLISEDKVAVIVLAGGQGTRLGVSHPKGMYDVGLPSHKTLFQIQAERIHKISQLACNLTNKQSTITYFIMTSESTMEPTLDYFKEHKFFGLQEKNVIMFEQCLLPTLTFDGKIILENKHKLSMSPDGNGGLYQALKNRKILEVMEARGIEYVHTFSIDNILVKVADPVFLGYCAEQQSDCAVKVIEKVFPEEAIGVICMVNEKWKVVEYSEIPPLVAKKRANDGTLLFKAGNICNHLFSTKFLCKIAENHVEDLELHVAKKKILTVDDDGNPVKPEQPNGIKMEKFIFDVFLFADKLVVWEVNRDEEFSALKNTDLVGKDCPTTARKGLFSLHKKWVERAGGKFNCNEPIVEISPLVSFAGEGIEKFVKGKILSSPFVLKSDCE